VIYLRNFLNDKAIELNQGAIRAMFDRAKNFPGSINLGIGEPDMHTPMEIIEEGCRALKDGKTHYTPNAGILEIREEIAKYLKSFNVSVDPDKEIIITTGGMGGLSLTLSVTISQGDEVLVQDPQWLNYYSQVKFFGGIPVPVPVYEKDSFKLTADNLRKKITAKTKILMLNSPNNPTGAVLEYEDLKEIAKVAIEHDLLVLSDEVYSTLLYDGTKHCSIASIEGMKDRTIIINSFSKAFAMTGWRIGFAAGNAEIIDKMVKLQENTVACVNASAQYAAIKALRCQDKVDEMVEIYKRRRDIIVQGLNDIKGISCYKPKGSFYVFANIKGLGKDSETVANELLEKAGVITIPGAAFGEYGEGYLRMSYANSEENIMEAIRRIKNYIKS
jgi:aminotransferase